MKVFVTGATGFIGSALVPELIAAGHEVVGLARSDATVGKLAGMGAAAHRGDLDDPRSLASGAANADATIHLAFDHGGMSDGIDKVIASDRRAINAIVEALAGTGKPLLGTSGVMVLTPGANRDESDAGDPDSAAGFRVPSENAVLAAAERGVRASVVRLAPVVHGEGDTHGFIPTVIAAAKTTGEFGYIGDGGNHWPAVHRLDAAQLFRLVLERGEAGARYHGVGESGVPLRSITSALGRSLDLPVQAIDAGAAEAHFGMLAPFAAIDLLVSSARTKAALGWNPRGPELLTDIEEGTYGTG